ncbi:hypothetical protein PCE1_000074 [Barthelona sp. PCE]
MQDNPNTGLGNLLDEVQNIRTVLHVSKVRSDLQQQFKTRAFISQTMSLQEQQKALDQQQSHVQHNLVDKLKEVEQKTVNELKDWRTSQMNRSKQRIEDTIQKALSRGMQTFDNVERDYNIKLNAIKQDIHEKRLKDAQNRKNMSYSSQKAEELRQKAKETAKEKAMIRVKTREVLKLLDEREAKKRKHTTLIQDKKLKIQQNLQVLKKNWKKSIMERLNIYFMKKYLQLRIETYNAYVKNGENGLWNFEEKEIWKIVTGDGSWTEDQWSELQLNIDFALEDYDTIIERNEELFNLEREEKGKEMPDLSKVTAPICARDEESPSTVEIPKPIIPAITTVNPTTTDPMLYVLKEGLLTLDDVRKQRLALLNEMLIESRSKMHIRCYNDVLEETERRKRQIAHEHHLMLKEDEYSRKCQDIGLWREQEEQLKMWREDRVRQSIESQDMLRSFDSSALGDSGLMSVLNNLEESAKQKWIIKEERRKMERQRQLLQERAQIEAELAKRLEAHKSISKQMGIVVEDTSEEAQNFIKQDLSENLETNELADQRRKEEEEVERLSRRNMRQEERRKREAVTRMRALLLSGGQFIKHGRRGRPHPRYVVLGDDMATVFWRDPKKSKFKNSMHIAEITDVVPGKQTAVFERSDVEPGLCFSLVGIDRTLDLQCETIDERDMWVGAFQYLITGNE